MAYHECRDCLFAATDRLRAVEHEDATGHVTSETYADPKD